MKAGGSVLEALVNLAGPNGRIRDEFLSEMRAKEILTSNKDVPYVDRILNASKYPVRKNSDGSISTHLLGYGESGGRYFVYPSLQYIDGSFVESDDPDSALKSGNVVWLEKEKDAIDFSKGSWKRYMDLKK